GPARAGPLHFVAAARDRGRSDPPCLECHWHVSQTTPAPPRRAHQLVPIAAADRHAFATALAHGARGSIFEPHGGQPMRRLGIGVAAVLASAGAAATAMANPTPDFGAWRDSLLRAFSFALFGVVEPVDGSSSASIDAATANANPAALV